MISDRVAGAIYFFVGTPLLSTLVYCRVKDENFLNIYWRPCYVLWMSVTYFFMYKITKIE